MASTHHPDLIVQVMACLAEGLGIRGTTRVFEIDPNTVLQWLGEAAEQLKAFSAYCLHDLPLNQGQLDELYAVLSAVRDGKRSEDAAIAHLSRSPSWVWTAMDPASKLLLIGCPEPRRWDTCSVPLAGAPGRCKGCAPHCGHCVR